jgi:hypothetical protein
VTGIRRTSATPPEKADDSRNESAPTRRATRKSRRSDAEYVTHGAPKFNELAGIRTLNKNAHEARNCHCDHADDEFNRTLSTADQESQ